MRHPVRQSYCTLNATNSDVACDADNLLDSKLDATYTNENIY